MSNQKNTYQLNIIKRFNSLIIYLSNSDYLIKLQKLMTLVVINNRKTGGKQTVMTKGRVDNRDVCWGSKEENQSTSSSSLLYCKTKHHLRFSNVEHHNIDTHHMRLVLIPSQIADDDSLIHKNKEYANILH